MDRLLLININNMIQINAILAIIITFGAIFAGGVAAFLIIRYQLLIVAKSALELTQKELKVYKDKTDRLEEDVKKLTQSLGIVKSENLALITERDYLRNLIISAINSKKNIQRELIEEMKSANDTKLYRDENDDNQEKL